MEKIQIFDNLSQAVEIANKKAEFTLQDSLSLYQTLVELSKVLELQEVLTERAKEQQEAQAKVLKTKTIKK